MSHAVASHNPKPLVIDGREPPLKRVFLFVFGLLVIGLPTWELRHAFLDPGWWTLFFGVIVAGAWTVGGLFIASAVAGQGLHWTIRRRRIRLERSSWLGVRHEILATRHVKAIEVEAVTWGAGAETHRAIVVLHSGERLATPDMATRAAAEQLAGEIRRRLSPR